MTKTEPRWKARGRTVAQLIDELAAFGNPQLEVRISFDGGATSLPVSLITQRDGYAVVENWQAAPSVMRHGSSTEREAPGPILETP